MAVKEGVGYSVLRRIIEYKREQVNYHLPGDTSL
jgi:hypothetical protein